MSWFTRLRNLFRSDSVSRDIDREMDFHIAERTDDLVSRGMSAEAAREEAKRRFGNYGAQKERTRERDMFASVDTLIGDLRYALRSLRSAPAFTAVAVLSLGLGIGANTAIFTLLDAVMLRSLPVHRPNELVMVGRGENGRASVFTNPLWEALRDRQQVFSGIAAYGSPDFNLADGGEVRLVAGNWVSGDFFSMLGLRPELGRLLAKHDDWRGCPPIAVISDAFWRREFGANQNVLGKTLSLRGHPYTVVGVVEPKFTGIEVGRATHVYAPLCSEAVMAGAGSALDARSTWYLSIIGRPKPGTTLAQVNAHLGALSRGVAEATLPPNFPADAVDNYLKTKLSAGPGAAGISDLREQYSKALWVLMAVVGLVLLIACANVANLLLARAAAREREMAVRLALGAGRTRLLRQLLTESLVLSSLGAVAGVAMASWGTRMLVALLTTSRTAVSLDLSADIRVLAFTTVVALVTGVLFGLAPAWRAGRVDPQTAMRANGRGVAGGSRFAMGKALVIAQVALSLVLVAGAGLLLGSWRRLSTTETGFRREGVLLVRVNTRGVDLADSSRAGLYRSLLQRLRGMPGVVSASTSDIAPFSGSAWNGDIQVEGFTPATERDAIVWMNEVSDGYIATLGGTMVAGRDFDHRDVPGSPKVAIVSESMAKRFYGNTSPIGKRFRSREGRDYGPPIEIVGVVKDMKYKNLREDGTATAFFAQTQRPKPAGAVSFAIRTSNDPSSAIPTIRAALKEANPRLLLEFATLEQNIDESLTMPRTMAALSGFFGALALLLATIGLYGIMAYSVARRRNEIGVRIALGAARGRVVRMVLGEVGRMVAVGVVIGTLLAVGASKLVVTFLYGVTPTDPAMLGGAAMVLATVGVGAALLPARRAAHLDPVEALREE